MKPVVERVVGWLRAGYPAGVPDTDYVPLVALLRRRLTDDEVGELGEELDRLGMLPAARIDVGVKMTYITDALPTIEEMERVSERLREAGWPVNYDHPLDSGDGG